MIVPGLVQSCLNSRWLSCNNAVADDVAYIGSLAERAMKGLDKNPWK